MWFADLIVSFLSFLFGLNAIIISIIMSLLIMPSAADEA